MLPLPLCDWTSIVIFPLESIFSLCLENHEKVSFFNSRFFFDFFFLFLAGKIFGTFSKFLRAKNFIKWDFFSNFKILYFSKKTSIIDICHRFQSSIFCRIVILIWHFALLNSTSFFHHHHSFMTWCCEHKRFSYLCN